MPLTRRSSRFFSNQKRDTSTANSPTEGGIEIIKNDDPSNEEELSGSDEEPSSGVYVFEGVQYNSYQEMVNAKRERNQRKLKESGLLSARMALPARSKTSVGSSKGIKPTAAKKRTTDTVPRRVSKRLKGETADNAFVHDERRNGRILVGGDNNNEHTEIETKQQFYRGRINNGDVLTTEEAIRLCDERWIDEGAVERATKLMQGLSIDKSLSPTKQPKDAPTPAYSSPSAVDEFPVVKEDKSLKAMIEALSVHDEENVAKVCPDRIYSVAVHPSLESTIVCAGDKKGYIGLWKRNHEIADQHCLFRPHAGAVSCLEWNASGRRLWSTSYDGTVRSLDVEMQQFEEIFATYNDDDSYRTKLGFGLDTGSNFWIQYGCVDPRNEDCLFLSTSQGSAMHVDLRTSQQRITFHHELSEKKINTLSVHRNGHTLVSAGLDCTVAVWDIRRFAGNKKKVSPLASYDCGRSINSAFFSASGDSLVCTTMAHTLEVFTSVSTASELQPSHVIRHDNKTGRWLTTFQAIYHPSIDHLFAVGSMAKPRRFDLFEDSQDKGNNTAYGVSGDALTAVVSRLAFHPRSDRIIVAGGNSSGRVTIAQ